MENLRNRIEFHLVQTPEKATKKASSPAFEKFTIFSEDLVGIHMVKNKLTLDRPIYTGFSILDLSKLIMYRFHYDVVKARYRDDAKLLFTDTGTIIIIVIVQITIITLDYSSFIDSLTYIIKTQDLYADYATQAEKYDFSGYPRNHPLFNMANCKVLGKFKDELDSVPVQEFVGLRLKMYSVLSTSGEKKTCKGICRRVVKKTVRHNHYRESMLNKKITIAEMRRIISKKHELYTVLQSKICLNPCDDKRHILGDGISTLAHGHYKIRT